MQFPVQGASNNKCSTYKLQRHHSFPENDGGKQYGRKRFNVG